MCDDDDGRLERPNFVPGRLLTQEDFRAEQEYARARQRRHNRLLHGWGIVDGLDVDVAAGGRVTVAPGHALAPNGDEICVRERLELVLGTPDPPRRVYVAVRVIDEFLEPTPLAGAGDLDAVVPARIREVPEVAVLDELPATYDSPEPTSTAALGLGPILSKLRALTRRLLDRVLRSAPAPSLAVDNPWVVLAAADATGAGGVRLSTDIRRPLR